MAKNKQQALKHKALKHKMLKPASRPQVEGDCYHWSTLGCAMVIVAAVFVIGAVYLLLPRSMKADERLSNALPVGIALTFLGLALYEFSREHSSELIADCVELRERLHKWWRDYIVRRQIKRDARLPKSLREELRAILRQQRHYSPRDVQAWLRLEKGIETTAGVAEYLWQQLRPQPVYKPPPPPVLAIEPAVPPTPAQAILGGIGMIFFFMLMFAVFSSFVAVAAILLDIFLPLWAAILLALPIGFVSFILLHAGDSTLLEFVVKYIIFLLLAWSFIGPVVTRSKQITYRQNQFTAAPRAQRR